MGTDRQVHVSPVCSHFIILYPCRVPLLKHSEGQGGKEEKE